MKSLWKKFTVFKLFSSGGKLFQLIGPEYIILCWDISFLGFVWIKFEDAADLNVGKLSFFGPRRLEWWWWTYSITAVLTYKRPTCPSRAKVSVHYLLKKIWSWIHFLYTGIYY